MVFKKPFPGFRSYTTKKLLDVKIPHLFGMGLNEFFAG